MPSGSGLWRGIRLSAVLAGSVAPLVMNSLPAIIGALAHEPGFDAAALGYFGSADTFGIAVGVFFGILLMRHFSPRATLFVGLIVLLAANVSSVATQQPELLIACRAIGGIGSGIALAACGYVYGLAERERNYGAYLLVQMALGTVFIILIPLISGRFGAAGLFVALAVPVLVCLWLCRDFPVVGKSSPQLSTSIRDMSPLTRWMGLLSVTLLCVGQMSLWAFLARMGAGAGLTESTIAKSLAVCAAFGFLSAAVVVALGERITARRVVLASTALNVLAASNVTASDPLHYTIAISAFYFSLPILVAAQFGWLMRKTADPRFASDISAAMYLGSALGPGIGAFVAARAQFSMLQALAVLLVLTACTLLWVGFINGTTIAPMRRARNAAAQVHGSDSMKPEAGER